VTQTAAPVAPAGYRHASGDDGGGCVPCQDDDGQSAGCLEPEPDPDEPGVCRWCSHTVEPEQAASLPCPDCEDAVCRCAA
jgi:hypothetical protein